MLAFSGLFQTFDLADLLAVVKVHTVIGTIVAGIITGLAVLYVDHSRAFIGRRAAMVWMEGSTFLSVLAVSALVSGSSFWETWLGVWLLWTLFVPCVAGTVWLRGRRQI